MAVMIRMLALLVVMAGCQKPSAPPPPPPPPTAHALALQSARQYAEKWWLLEGRCKTITAGDSKSGPWVLTRKSDLCTNVEFFTPAGAARFDSACCEGTCRPELDEMGPATRDLCAEALEQLRAGPMWLSSYDDTLLVTRLDSGRADGMEAQVTAHSRGRWPLSGGGRYRAKRTTGVEVEFEVSGNRVTPVGGAQLQSDKGHCALGTDREPGIVTFFPCE